MNQKVFTLLEASSLIPQLKTILSEIQVKRKSVVRLEEELNELYVDNEGRVEPYKQEDYKLKRTMINALYQDLNELATEITTLGCQMKDLNKGLVDFLAIRSGEYVYLCWMFGEDTIRFWHTLYDGFSGRRPIDDF